MKKEVETLATKNLEEVLGIGELDNLIESGTKLKHYIGFEISGLVHLGTGLSCLLKVKDLQKLGVDCTIFLADWHSWINNKLGGDHDLIQKVAKEYFEPAMRVSAKIIGADTENMNFVYGSDLYHNNDRYWQTVVEVSKNLTLSRVLKSTSIMGREERNNQPFAWLLYPPMQVADIFELGVNIAHSGMDQRKVHVIAREVANKLEINPLKDTDGKKIKPIAMHHSLLLGLQPPKNWPIEDALINETIRSEMKMSKSIPGSAIFVHDSPEKIKSKVKKAFCPERITTLNPIINWTGKLILPLLGEIVIKREDKHGGTITISDTEELESRYTKGDLHPADLKNAVSETLIEILKPARETFSDKGSIDLIERIKRDQ